MQTRYLPVTRGIAPHAAQNEPIRQTDDLQPPQTPEQPFVNGSAKTADRGDAAKGAGGPTPT